MELWIVILAGWLPLAGLVLALCLYEGDDRVEPALARPKIRPNPADES